MNPFSGGLPNFMPQTPVINPAAQQITSNMTYSCEMNNAVCTSPRSLEFYGFDPK